MGEIIISVGVLFLDLWTFSNKFKDNTGSEAAVGLRRRYLLA